MKSLPPLFRKVPFEEISSPSSESWGNLSTKFGMEQSETEMVFWLLDLLVDVTLKVEANEMSSRSIGKSASFIWIFLDSNNETPAN